MEVFPPHTVNVKGVFENRLDIVCQWRKNFFETSRNTMVLYYIIFRGLPYNF